MPEIPVGDVVRSFKLPGWLRWVMNAVKGLRITRGGTTIVLSQRDGATPPRTGGRSGQYRPRRRGTVSPPMDVPVLAIPGNHDHAGPGTVWEQDFFRREQDGPGIFFPRINVDYSLCYLAAAELGDKLRGVLQGGQVACGADQFERCFRRHI